jgi:hypothetical protein
VFDFRAVLRKLTGLDNFINCSFRSFILKFIKEGEYQLRAILCNSTLNQLKSSKFALNKLRILI